MSHGMSHDPPDGCGDHLLQPQSFRRLRGQRFELRRVGRNGNLKATDARSKEMKQRDYALSYTHFNLRSVCEWCTVKLWSREAVKLWRSLMCRCVPSRSCNRCLDPDPLPPGYAPGRRTEDESHVLWKNYEIIWDTMLRRVLSENFESQWFRMP